MKMTTFKKLFAAILAVVMVLCLLAGCGNEAAQQTDPVVQNPTAAGMLVLSTAASVSISYDADGMVLMVDGNNDDGFNLSDNYTDYTGKTCAVVAKELIEASAKIGSLSADVKNIVIKQSVGSALPGTDFLATIEAEVKAAAEAAGSAAVITVIDETMLDENGYINLDTAKALLCNELGVEKLDKYYGAETPNDGSYICTAEIAGKQTSHNIDAVTGVIADATEEELLGDPEDDEKTISDDSQEDATEENIIEDAPDEEIEDTLTDEATA